MYNITGGVLDGHLLCLYGYISTVAENKSGSCAISKHVFPTEALPATEKGLLLVLNAFFFVQRA